MLWGFSSFHHVLRFGNTWLTDSELLTLKRSRDALLFCYQKLSLEAAERMVHRYPMKPKHHMLSEAARRAQISRLNPGSHWAFCEEDNVGFMMRICQGCKGSTMGTRSLQRWCLQFFWSD